MNPSTLLAIFGGLFCGLCVFFYFLDKRRKDELRGLRERLRDTEKLADNYMLEAKRAEHRPEAVPTPAPKPKHTVFINGVDYPWTRKKIAFESVETMAFSKDTGYWGNCAVRYLPVALKNHPTAEWVRMLRGEEVEVAEDLEFIVEPREMATLDVNGMSFKVTAPSIINFEDLVAAALFDPKAEGANYRVLHREAGAGVMLELAKRSALFIRKDTTVHVSDLNAQVIATVEGGSDARDADAEAGSDAES